MEDGHLGAEAVDEAVQADAADLGDELQRNLVVVWGAVRRRVGVGGTGDQARATNPFGSDNMVRQVI